MNLAELQRFFAEAATSGTGPHTGLEAVFVTDAQLSASARLGIYNRAYYFRLLDALASVFEQVQRCLGRAEFERIGLSYLGQHPSEHPAVERVGRLFPEYLRILGRGDALADLAELEWARLCALVAPNPRAVAARANIDTTTFPRARLTLVPALRSLQLAPAALAAFSGQALATGDPSLPGERIGVAVWRRQHAVSQQELGALEFQALQLAARGASTSEICAGFHTGNAAADALRAFQILGAWLDREWVESLALYGA